MIEALVMFAKRGQGKIDLRRALANQTSLAPYKQLSFQMRDMRKSIREDIWCECVLAANGIELREAVITDISATGVRVRFRRRGELPFRVRVRAVRLGLNREAYVAWQTAFDAGLSFAALDRSSSMPFGGSEHHPRPIKARRKFGKK